MNWSVYRICSNIKMENILRPNEKERKREKWIHYYNQIAEKKLHRRKCVLLCINVRWKNTTASAEWIFYEASWCAYILIWFLLLHVTLTVRCACVFRYMFVSDCMCERARANLYTRAWYSHCRRRHHMINTKGIQTHTHTGTQYVYVHALFDFVLSSSNWCMVWYFFQVLVHFDEWLTWGLARPLTSSLVFLLLLLVLLWLLLFFTVEGSFGRSVRSDHVGCACIHATTFCQCSKIQQLFVVFNSSSSIKICGQPNVTNKSIRSYCDHFASLSLHSVIRYMVFSHIIPSAPDDDRS